LRFEPRLPGIVEHAALRGDMQGEIQHRLLARTDRGGPVVDRELIGDQRVLGEDAQDRAVGDHAVQAAVIGADGDHDHLLLGLGQAVGGTLHQRIVVGEEGAEFVGAVRQHEKHVGHEAGLGLHREDALAHVLRQRIEIFGERKTADRLGHVNTP